MYPAPYGPDGFGLYNLMDKDIRRRQALLAKEHGIHGFAMYHYHFGPQDYGLGSTAADMDETTMKLLDAADGEPNMPFYLVWANSPFVWRWNTWNKGRISELEPGSIQVQQTYPQSGWRAHYEYLRRFFSHPNYHKVDGGKPVFGVFNMDTSSTGTPAVPAEMFEQYKEWAIADGFPGIYVLQVILRIYLCTHMHTEEYGGTRVTCTHDMHMHSMTRTNVQH